MSSIVINGDALDEDTKEANLEGLETVLALTNDENNMMACVLAEKQD